MKTALLYIAGIIGFVWGFGVWRMRRNGNGWPISLLWPLVFLFLLIFGPIAL